MIPKNDPRYSGDTLTRVVVVTPDTDLHNAWFSLQVARINHLAAWFAAPAIRPLPPRLTAERARRVVRRISRWAALSPWLWQILLITRLRPSVTRKLERYQAASLSLLAVPRNVERQPDPASWEEVAVACDDDTLAVCIGVKPPTILPAARTLLALPGWFPQRSGVDAILWAVYHREADKLGATVITAPDDHGRANVIQRRWLAVGEDDPWPLLAFRTDLLAGEMVVDLLRDGLNPADVSGEVFDWPDEAEAASASIRLDATAQDGLRWLTWAIRAHYNFRPNPRQIGGR